jgi:predicted acetyltransferase
MKVQPQIIKKKIKGLTPLELEEIKSFLIKCFDNNPDFVSTVYTNPDLNECLLLYISNKLVGHIGINKRIINHQNKTYVIAGIGDVAIDNQYRSQGLGNMLMKEVNKIIKENEYDLGVLFCHPKLDNFYSSSGWFSKNNGKIFATVNGALEDQRRTFLLPIRLTKRETEIWNNKDINIGNGSW